MEFTKRESGWKVDQRYNTDVLQGNWFEDRMEFQRGSHPGETASIYGNTFRPHDGGQEERFLDRKKRMNGLLQSDGLKPETMVHHHGKKYIDGLAITSYDQDFCRGKGEQLRAWDKWHSDWRPERSDYPLQGIPTKTGALDRLKERTKKEAEFEKQSDYGTTQRLSFTPHTSSSFASKRFATPRIWSSHLHPHIQNKSMTLRGHSNVVTVERVPLADSKGQALADPG